jgi:DNA-binding response OmpR family regulator
VPKTRKYPCCIRILHESTKNRPKVQLVLLIKGRQVGATQKQAALLACLHENQGRIVCYKQLNLILGHKSGPQQLHILRQYVLWISKTLAAHKALCMIAVAPRVGYVLCGHE